MRADRRALFEELADGGKHMLKLFEPSTARVAWPYPSGNVSEDRFDLTRRLLDLRHKVLQLLIPSVKAGPRSWRSTAPKP